MATLTIPKPDDNEYLPSIGHNFIKINDDQNKEAMWNEGKTFGLLNWEDLPGGSEGNSTAKRFYEQTIKSDWLAQSGESIDIRGESSYYNALSGENEPRTGDIITAQAANDKYGLDGRLNFDRDITVAEAQILHGRKIKEMQFQQLMGMQSGLWQKTKGIGWMGLSALVNDPVNMGLLFAPDPTASKIGFLGLSVKRGIDVARFVSGARSAAFWSAVAEVPVALQKFNEQADYTAWDSLLNVTFGGVLGGGIHVVGGRTADWIMGVSRQRHAMALDLAYKQATSDADINVDAILKAAKDVARKKNIPEGKLITDLDAADLQRAYNARTGYRPPLLEYRPNEIDEGPTMGEITQKPLDLDEMPGAPLLDEEFTASSGKLGSNEGNTVIHNTTGEKWYIKKPANKEWAINELIASVIMKRLLGDTAPFVRPVIGKDGSFVGIASKWKEGTPLTMEKVNAIIKNNPKAYQDFIESSMIHAWLGNRDFAAQGNLIVDQSGRIHSIDAGGSIKFRAMGEVKIDWIENDLPEFVSFLIGKNSDIDAHIKNMTVEMLANAIRKIYQMSDEEIEAIVSGALDYAGKLTKQEQAEINNITFALINRRDSVAKKDLGVLLSNIVDKDKIPAGLKDKLLQDGLDIGELASDEFQKLSNRKTPYKKFYSFKQVKEYINKQIDNLQKLLTKEEINALQSWAASSSSMHAFASNVAKGVDLVEEYGKSALKDFQKQYNNLLSAINKVKTQDNFIVYAGKDASNFAEIEGMPFGPQLFDDAYKMKGMEFTSDSFFNGSLLHHIGYKFTGGKNKPVKLRILVPKGTNMTFVDKAFKSATGGYNEAEVLFAPGTVFKIRDARYVSRSSKGEYIKGQGNEVLHITAEVKTKGMQTMSMDDILKHAKANYENKHGTVTADVELSPKIRALNARERIQKIEANVNNKELTAINKEIDMLTDELAAYNSDIITKEINELNQTFNDGVKKNKSIGQALKAVLNCAIGKS
jgi:hypothetical protein